MRDDEHAIVRMKSAQIEERGNDALGELLVRLAVLPAGSPGDVRSIWKARPDLVHGHPLPVADVDLAERLQLLCLEPETSGDDVRSLNRAPERARVDGGQSFVAKAVRELDGLAPTRLVEGCVRMSLVAALAVPVGLTMTHEDDRRGHAG